MRTGRCCVSCLPSETGKCRNVSGYNLADLATSFELQHLSGDAWSHDAFESTQESLHKGSYDDATGDVQHQVTASQLDSTIVQGSMPNEG